MADPNQDTVEGGTHAHPLDDTLAQTGPGIPDDAASPDYDPVADAAAEHDVEKVSPQSADTLFNGP